METYMHLIFNLLQSEMKIKKIGLTNKKNSSKSTFKN